MKEKSEFFLKKFCTFENEGYICTTKIKNAGVAQLVEHNLAKVGVAGPSPVSRSKIKVQSFKFRANYVNFELLTLHQLFALVVELVDTQDLKSCNHCGCAGSSPARGTESSAFAGLLTFLGGK